MTSRPARTTRHRPRGARVLWRSLLVAVCAADLYLLFMVVHDRLFFEEPTWEFLASRFDAVTLRIGQLFVLASLLVGFYTGAIPSTEAMGKRVIEWVRPITHPRGFGVALSVALSLTAVGFGYLFLSGNRFYPTVLQGSSPVLVPPDGSEVYMADEIHRGVCWWELETPDAKSGCIAIEGQPSQLVYAPQADQVLVTDLESKAIVVINRRVHALIQPISGLGSRPRSIIVTPDGHKAYVSADQIIAVDLMTKPYRLTGTRIPVPSPKGMAIRGRRLYIATEPGSGGDAVYVVDTTTDRILDRLPEFGGSHVAIVGEAGRTLYVSRGNSLEALDISKHKLEPGHLIPLDTPTSALAVTEDGRTALVASGRRITAIDTDSDATRLTSNLANDVKGVAISRNRAYAWIGTKYTFDIRSLRPGTRPDVQRR